MPTMNERTPRMMTGVADGPRREVVWVFFDFDLEDPLALPFDLVVGTSSETAVILAI